MCHLRQMACCLDLYMPFAKTQQCNSESETPFILGAMVLTVLPCTYALLPLLLPPMKRTACVSACRPL